MTHDSSLLLCSTSVTNRPLSPSLLLPVITLTTHLSLLTPICHLRFPHCVGAQFLLCNDKHVDNTKSDRWTVSRGNYSLFTSALCMHIHTCCCCCSCLSQSQSVKEALCSNDTDCSSGKVFRDGHGASGPLHSVGQSPHTPGGLCVCLHAATYDIALLLRCRRDHWNLQHNHGHLHGLCVVSSGGGGQEHNVRTCAVT